MKHSRSRTILLTLTAALAAAGAGCLPATDAPADPAIPSVSEKPCRIGEIPEEVRCGTLRVFENREARSGRILELQFVVLPARKRPAAPDPIVSIYGGPGQTATEFAEQEWQSSARDERELILLDQRGTSRSMRLDCELGGSERSAQEILEPAYRPGVIGPCLERLRGRTDLTRYGTAAAMDDLEDLRALLGYEKLNLMGGSYGSRAALTYLQRHPGRVRSLVLFGLAPFSVKLPLNHARAAQEALDGLFAACAAQPSCRQAFPRLDEELDAVLRRLEESPVEVAATHPGNGEPATVRLGRRDFVESLRVMTYGEQRASRVPLAIHRAFLDDFAPFADLALASNHRLRSSVRLGMHLSVTCTEDVARLTEDEIVRETRGMYLRDDRVRQQIAACEGWPRGALPADFGKLGRSQVPALLLSGFLDPATPPRFGEEVVREHLPNSVHLVVRTAGHAPFSECFDRIAASFLRDPEPRRLDTSCAEAMRLEPFVTEAEP